MINFNDTPIIDEEKIIMAIQNEIILIQFHILKRGSLPFKTFSNI